MPIESYKLTHNFHSSSTSCGKRFSRHKLTLKNEERRIILHYSDTVHSTFLETSIMGPKGGKKRFEF
jgi:hypothetical protein